MNIIESQGVPAVDYVGSAFKKPKFDTRLAESKFIDAFPVSGVKDVSNVRFVLPLTPGPFVYDISKLFVAINLKIMNKAHDDVPPAGTDVAPVDNFVMSLYKSVTIFYNSEPVCKITNFPLYAYYYAMLSSNNGDFETWLTNQCFHRDVHRKEDRVSRGVPSPFPNQEERCPIPLSNTDHCLTPNRR